MAYDAPGASVFGVHSAQNPHRRSLAPSNVSRLPSPGSARWRPISASCLPTLIHILGEKLSSLQGECGKR